jgi:beta-glucuronidase
MSHVDVAGTDVPALNDPLGEYLDVLGLNEYLRWYGGRPEEADGVQWRIAWSKPLIVSEFGVGAEYGSHREAAERSTAEDQASLYQHQINMLRNIPSLAGLSPWVLTGSYSPHRFLPGIQDYYSRKELASILGKHERVRYVLQKFHREIEPAK